MEFDGEFDVAAGTAASEIAGALVGAIDARRQGVRGEPDSLLEIRARLAAEFDVSADLDAWLHPSAEAPTGAVPGSLIDDAVRQAIRAVQALIVDHGARLDAAALEDLAVGVERVRRCAEAAAVAVAERVDATNPSRGDGFFSGKAWLRHRLQLTKSEAYRRVQVARHQDRVGSWTEVSQGGEVGIAQSQLMAQIAANQRISDDDLAAAAPDLLVDAQTLPYDEFERRARRFEELADPVGAADDHQRLDDRRDARLKAKRNGGWTLSASLPELAGSRFADVFAAYLDREWDTDWNEATKRCGDDATVADLRRSEPQRRADALMALVEAAASAPPNGVRAVPTLDVLCDAATLAAVLQGLRIPASRCRDVVCRTQSGRVLHLSEAASLAVWAEVRRVLLDERGVVVNMGRRQRLFKGAAREAALLTTIVCRWPGCSTPVGRLEVDHARSWKHHGGCTDQDNADGLCRGHNLLKEHGYRMERDEAGTWHVYHPDGHEIV